jgi:hypothetical protein
LKWGIPAKYHSGVINRRIKMDIKARLSTFWIVVMINMAFADILGFMIPGNLV